MTEVRAGAPSASSPCQACGEPIPTGDRFCRACGQPVDPNVISKPSGGKAQDDPWASIVRRLRTLVGHEFQIVRELGRGGMAAVYLAYEPALDRNVAMKIMSPALLTGPGMIERFQREARTVAKLVHPNIIALYTVRQIEDLHFFTMQFVEGRSLDRVIHDAGQLPIRTIRSLLFTIGNALGYAHRRGVVHRDVKPANILINDEGSAVVTDFGIAKVAQDTSGPNTQTNALVGTPAYISPEQCYGHPATEASDQYSLGILAFELLTGHVPFSGTPFVVLQAHTEKAIPSIKARRADCPPELEAAVMRMLEKTPANRWPTMQHALAELGAVPLPEGDPEQIALARLALPEGTGRLQDMRWTPVRPQNDVRAERPVTPAPAPYIASIAILAPPETIEVGDAINLVAAARNATGATMPGTRFVWTVDNAAVASVDSGRGEVRALSAGEAEITATAGGVSNSVRLVVTPRKVAAVKISLPPGSFQVGDSVRLVARAEDKTQATVGEGIHWMSGDSSVAEVTDEGVLLARGAGVALIWAEAQGVRGSARVQINPAPVTTIQLSSPPDVEAGERFTLQAIALGPHGEALSDRTFSWKSSDPKVAVISPSGVVETRAAGRTKLTCSCEARESTINLVVPAPATARIAITRPNRNPVAGESIKLEAQAYSRRDLPIERKFRWSADPSGLAKVSRHGEVKTLASGIVTVVASTDDGETSLRLEIEPAPEPIVPVPLMEAAAERVAAPVESGHVHVPRTSRRRLVLGAGATVAVIAAALILRGLTSSSGAAVDSTANKLVVLPETAKSPGPDTSGKRDTTTPPPPPRPITPVARTIAVRGVPSRVFVGDVVNLSAEARDASKKVIVPSSIRWTSSDPSVATIDRATGRLIARADGRTRVTVEGDSALQTVAIEVAKKPVVADDGKKSQPAARALSITATDTVLSVGETVGLTPVRSGPASAAAVAWESERPGVAQVDQQGRVTAVAPGTSTISASWEGVRGTVRISVRAVAVANVAVSAPGGTVTEGQQVQLRATLTDARNNQLTGREISWQSENPSVASVSSSGVVTAIRAGSAPIVALSEGRTGRVVIPIAARAVVDTKTGEKTGEKGSASGSAPAAGPVIERSIDDFVKALNAHSGQAVRSVVDDATWKQLEAKVERSEWKLRAQTPIRGNPQAAESQTTVEFRVPLEWTKGSGKRVSATGVFRATFVLSGNAWTLQRITLLNQID